MVLAELGDRGLGGEELAAELQRRTAEEQGEHA